MTTPSPSIAICIVAYNRIDSIQRLLESLSCAQYLQEATLIISVDKSKTDIVEKYADEFVWTHGKKIVAKHSENLGLRKHILSIGDYLHKYDAIVVLEDDLIVSPSFYNYSLEAVQKYKDDDRIAGISLYGFSTNLQTGAPFVPDRDEYDAFLFQNAQSWGQVWMKNQWFKFKSWYEKHSEEYGDAPHLPHNICHWPKSSWLKYHTKYCIEQNKFFVYPYVPLTFCTGAAGVHSSETNNRVHNVMQQGMKSGYLFPEYDNAIKYDGFFERLCLDRYIEYKDVCFDLYGEKGNREQHRYWLTTTRAPYKILKEFGLMYIPIEQNIIRSTPGSGIFLYDTTEPQEKPKDNTFNLLNYHYKVDALLGFMRNRGFVSSSIQIIRYVFHKLKAHI